MLFVALLKVKSGTEKERASRRLQWDTPEGATIKAEYWLHACNPQCIVILESNGFAEMMLFTSAWDDVFDIDIHPAITAEEGMKEIKQMME